MNKFNQFFNYNFIKIIKENIKNNEIKILKKQEKKEISNLILKKQICAIVFVIINFLTIYTSSIEIYKIKYQNNILMHIFKDNINTSLTLFAILIVLPIITNIIITKKIKSKYYILIILLYLISNLLNILMITYFIISFLNNIILGILGIINVIITIIINSNIIIKIKENYLK